MNPPSSLEDNIGTPGLVLSGGGARGAYQVGVVKALAEALPGPSPFPVITGVSVGAINAVVLAERADDFGDGALHLESLWRGLSCARVFKTSPTEMISNLLGWSSSFLFGWAGATPPKSFLDATPLANLLNEAVDYDRIGRMISEGYLRALAVTASSYATGFSTTFFQGEQPLDGWCRSRRQGREAVLTPTHVLASAALPGVFQAQRIGREWYGDGALRQTAPLSPAIHLGCDRLLLIAARDGSSEEPIAVLDDEPYPSIGVLGGQLLDIVFNDNLDADRERLERINATLGMMIPERRDTTALRFLKTTMVRPSRDVRSIAGEHIREIPMTVRMLLGALGAMREPFVLPSYLTFEPGYIGDLIDLGYEDAKADLPQLLRFLGQDMKPKMAVSS